MRSPAWLHGAVVLLCAGAARADEHDEPQTDAVRTVTPGADAVDAADSDSDSDSEPQDDDGDDAHDVAPPPQEPVDPLRKGLELQGSFGLGDCTGGFCTNGDEGRMHNTRLGLGLELSGWYRPMPLLSFGAGFHYGLVGAHDRERVDNGLDYFTFELGGRVHPLQHGPIDAFAGVQLGYLVYGITSDYTERDIVTTETTNAFFAALEAGGEYYLNPQMSAGGLLKVAFPIWLDQCLETLGQEDCDPISDLPDSLREAFPSTYWYLGGTFTYHLAL